MVIMAGASEDYEGGRKRNCRSQRKWDVTRQRKWDAGIREKGVTQGDGSDIL